jgi:hypothetical protein
MATGGKAAAMEVQSCNTYTVLLLLLPHWVDPSQPLAPWHLLLMPMLP